MLSHPNGPRLMSQLDVEAEFGTKKVVYMTCSVNVQNLFLLSSIFVGFSDVPIDVPGYGKVVVDIGYGGAFYAFLSADQLGLDVSSARIRDLVEAASAVTDAVKSQVGPDMVSNCMDGCTNVKLLVLHNC